MERYKEVNHQHVALSSEGRKIFDTKHSIGRFFDRFPANFDKDKIFWVIKNAIRDIIKKYKDKSAHYVIHSKSTGIGVVVDWRMDTMNRSDSNYHAFIMTVLPVKKSHTHKPSDIYLIVEKQLEEWADVQYVEKYGEKRKFEEGMCTLVNEDNFVVVFYEGSYYDDTIHHLIIVD